MGLRPLLLALLALVVGACATPSDPAGQPAATTSSPTAISRAAGTSPAEDPPAEDPPPPGIIAPARRQPAPDLQVTAFHGSIVTLDQFRGRPAVVSFFESWCPICQTEQPDLSKVAKQFAGQVGFVGVSNHDTVAAGRAYARRFQVPYPLANDASGKTWARWRVPYQPVTVLVDNHGRIAERFDGGTTGGTLRAALTYLTRE
jgi:peroxiredoxin